MKKLPLLEQELIIRMDQGDVSMREYVDRQIRLSLGVSDIETTPTAAINNLIDNGDYNWSHDAYLNPGITPATAGDANNRAYNWFRMQRATALLVEDDANSLKGAAHSLFAGESADTPRWLKTDGWAELGETGGTPWDIACPLSNNFATPGMRFHLQMLVRLRTATAVPGALKFFWLLQDNTAASPATIKGSPLALNGAVYGPVGATTRDYKIVIDTDSGGQVESTVLSITNAPAVLSPSNGVALSWEFIPGFTNVSIYVTVGGASFLVGIIGNGASAFNDTGQVLGSVASVPTVTDTAASAIAVADPFAPTTDWQLWTFKVFVPQTYDASLTTGKQWLRGGVIGLMGDPHQLQIDRVGMDYGPGLWGVSAHDRLVTSLPSTSQVGSSQGPPSGGGEEPGDGEGAPHFKTVFFT